MLSLGNATCSSGAELLLLGRWVLFLRRQKKGGFKKRMEGRVTFPPREGKLHLLWAAQPSHENGGGGGVEGVWCYMVLLVVNSLNRTKTQKFEPPTLDRYLQAHCSVWESSELWEILGLDFFITQSNIFLCSLFASEVVCMFLLTVWRQTGGTVVYCAWWGQGRGRRGGR